MSDKLTVQEAALAWAQGKKVEAKFADGGEWYPIAPVGGQAGYAFDAHVFSEDSVPVLFRLASEPPAKRYRPYTQDELDGIRLLGEVVVRKDRKCRALITVALEEAVGVGMSHFTFKDLLDQFTWLDGSPCGVEVKS